MTSTLAEALPAEQQIAALEAARGDLEREMVEAAHDPAAFARLEQRRAAIDKEIARLGYAVKLEAEQAAEQEIRDLHARDHATWDKVADIRARFGERDRQIGGMLGSAESLAADDDLDLRQHRLLEGSSAPPCSERSATAARRRSTRAWARSTRSPRPPRSGP
jgi:hypothetical protein